MPKFSIIEKRNIVKMYAAGEKIEYIATKYGTSKAHIVMVARRSNIPPRQIQNRKDIKSKSLFNKSGG